MTIAVPPGKCCDVFQKKSTATGYVNRIYAHPSGKYLSRLGLLDYVIIPKKGFKTQLGTSSVPIPRRMSTLGMTRQIRDGGL